jgi:O-antigen/teichoic acid export membrane protein
VLGLRILSVFEQVNKILMFNSALLSASVVFNIIFIKFFGVTGIAMATLICYVSVSTAVTASALITITKSQTR